nr:13510_t:CDS:2 [Entrophospora candida]
MVWIFQNESLQHNSKPAKGIVIICRSARINQIILNQLLSLKLSGKQADKINASCTQIAGTSGEDLIEDCYLPMWPNPLFWPHVNYQDNDMANFHHQATCKLLDTLECGSFQIFGHIDGIVWDFECGPFLFLAKLIRQ